MSPVKRINHIALWYNPREGLTTHLTGAALVETGRVEVRTISYRPNEEDWVLALRATTQN
ncbi:MAG: putative collagen-binding domain-containing protein [Planctomycetota bacterium]